jgi:hypothetical protein
MSRELYPEIVFDDTIASEFDEVDDAVQAVADACDGWGTDEDALIECLATKTPEQRYQIYYRYEELRGENLSDRIDNECGEGNFGRAMELLSLPPDLAEAKMIKLACSGVGTDERVLFPLILGRSDREIDQLKKAYYKKYEEDLGTKLSGELSGKFERLIFYALQGIEQEYDPEFHTEEKVEIDVDAFYEAGQGSWGTDEGEIFELLCVSPPEHLMAMNEKYTEKYGNNMFHALGKELTGILDDATFYLLGMKINPVDHAAAIIHKACAGWGTDDLLLTTSLIRFHEILGPVAEQYEILYGQSLYDRVDGETSGNYGQMLCKLIESSV